MSLVNRIARFASSPQGRRLADKARNYAASPEGRRQIEQMRSRMARRGKPGGARPR